jgi:UDPglucose--hexose-1-phosphate uridylyltransferase
VAELRTDPITGVRALVGAPPRAGIAVMTAAPPVLAPTVPGLAADAPTPAAEANRDLFLAGPASGAHAMVAPEAAVERLSDLGADGTVAFAGRWREAMRGHGEAASLHLTVDDRPDGLPLAADLYALDFVPTALARERERFGAYATRTMGGNLLADLVQEEVRRRERIVAIDPEAVLIAPWGSRAPYQLMVAPRRPRARWEDDGPAGAAMLAGAVSRLAGRFGAAPPVTVWVRTAPRGAEHYAWRIDVLPRLVEPSGLELGTGVPYNPVWPEVAAGELRDAAV